jgi:hypothetical protein
MLLRHRGTLTLFTLVVLAAVTVSGGVWLRSTRIDPATASRPQLLRYLVLTDLSVEPLAVQQAWVDRLQVELTSDEPLVGDGKSEKIELSAGFKAKLLANIQTLQSVWFQKRSAEYARLSAAERDAFMLDQLEVVGAWAKIGSLLAAEPVPVEVATRHLIERIDHWTTEAKGQEREDMIAAVNAGTLCWLSTSDLSTYPAGVKRELAQRLAIELDRGASPKIDGMITDPARHEKLVANAGQLVEAYIHAIAQQYHALSSTTERNEFVDQQLANVEKWRLSELLAGPGSNAPVNRAAAALALVEQSKRWVANASEEERPAVQSLVGAIEQRLLWKQMPKWLRGS